MPNRHPDLDDNGELKPDVDLPVDARDFLRMSADQTQWSAFMDRVAAAQRREAEDVQQWVGGRTYAGDPYTAYQAYLRDLERVRRAAGRERELNGYDVEAMTLEEYDRAFDEHGRPRDGFSFRHSDRDIPIDDQQSRRIR